MRYFLQIGSNLFLHSQSYQVSIDDLLFWPQTHITDWNYSYRIRADWEIGRSRVSDSFLVKTFSPSCQSKNLSLGRWTYLPYKFWIKASLRVSLYVKFLWFIHTIQELGNVIVLGKTWIRIFEAFLFTKLKYSEKCESNKQKFLNYLWN